MSFLPTEPNSPLAFLNLDETFLNSYGISIDTFWLKNIDYLHFHDYFQLYYTVKGEYVHTINGESKVCKPGDVSLIMPYTVHQTDTRESDIENTFVITISLLPKFFTQNKIPFSPLTYKESVYKNTLIPTSLLLQGTDKEKADSIIKDIYFEYQKHSGMLLTKIARKLCSFFDICEKKSPHSAKLSILNKSKSIYLEAERIRDNRTKKLSIDDAAQRTSLSRSTFTRTFRKVTGMTFHDMHSSMRMNLVIELMRFSRKSIEEIAEECGYSSSAHFTKECIKLFSYPPQRLRKAMIEIARQQLQDTPQRQVRKSWEHFRSAELVKEHFNASIGKY